jgi:exosome complex component RRP46
MPSQINVLPASDGSSTHTYLGTTVLTSINGPLEVSRRDENPEAATIDVNVRTATGPGSPRDRHLEQLVLDTLNYVVVVKQLPRTLIQVTLQILDTPVLVDQLPSGLRSSTLLLLPALLSSVNLALLAANIPLASTLAVRLVLTGKKEKEGEFGEEEEVPFSVNLDALNILSELKKYDSPISGTHLFVFAVAGRRVELVTQASEGDFTPEEWSAACEVAGESLEDDTGMDVDGRRVGDGMNLLSVLKA